MLVKDFETLSPTERSALVKPYNMRWVGTGRDESAEEYIERYDMRLLYEEDGFRFCASTEDMYGDPVDEEIVVVVIDGGYFFDL